MKSIFKPLIVSSFLLICLSACASAEVSTKSIVQLQTNTDGYIYVGDKLLVGEIEKVIIQPVASQLEARIDTGATTSSLDVRNIRRFKQNGRDWVQFDLLDRQTGEVITIERPLVRNARIMQSNAEESEVRPVVLMPLTLADKTWSVAFSLTDRKHLTYPVLIGRNVIKGRVVVDVSKKHIAPLKLSVHPSTE